MGEIEPVVILAEDVVIQRHTEEAFAALDPLLGISTTVVPLERGFVGVRHDNDKGKFSVISEDKIIKPSDAQARDVAYISSAPF